MMDNKEFAKLLRNALSNNEEFADMLDEELSMEED